MAQGARETGLVINCHSERGLTAPRAGAKLHMPGFKPRLESRIPSRRNFNRRLYEDARNRLLKYDRRAILPMEGNTADAEISKRFCLVTRCRFAQSAKLHAKNDLLETFGRFNRSGVSC